MIIEREKTKLHAIRELRTMASRLIHVQAEQAHAAAAPARQFANVPSKNIVQATR